MTGEGGAVTASSVSAVDAGVAILRQGGNAVDAAVAAALTSCVADPCNTGLGGYGGHMVIASPGEAALCVDFDMWASASTPLAAICRAHPTFGPAATVIPNVVAGLSRALERFGSMAWAEVSAPAIGLATEGVVPNATTLHAFSDVKDADFVQECFTFDTRLDRERTPAKFRQPALARTLEALAAKGPQWFYEGPIGDGACKVLQQAGREIGRREWAEAPEAVRIMPASAYAIEGHTLFSAPLATSGAPCMFATLASGATLMAAGALDAPDTVRAWARHLAAIWTYRFGTERGNDFNNDTADAWVRRAIAFTAPVTISPSVGHTCHLNVVDQRGMAVALTFTHGPFWFGGRWAVPETGIVMNAGMHLFTGAKPVPAGGRAYAVTNMAPTVASLADGSAVAIGCPGARRIPTNIGLVLARHLLAGQDLQAAVSAGRFHAETSTAASLESGHWQPEIEQALAGAFDRVEVDDWRRYYGPLTAIRRFADGRVALGLDDRELRGYGRVIA